MQNGEGCAHLREGLIGARTVKVRIGDSQVVVTIFWGTAMKA